ncbi:hypothetical protein RUM44_007162 [Polyplax serrata]|uniref:C-type lectin domain-containing protein n=1 Tax=Polyplax serrata TaxID=468196 RepID=A0ABR1B0P4_POLSC
MFVSEPIANMYIVSHWVVAVVVNISNVWFLPQEGFPVFYKFFNDKVTWNEAEAVCGYHHADVLSVQTSARMDAARAYLKEIDVSDNVWIGLQKDSSEKPFSWSDGEKLVGDGYWLEPIPKTNEKLCAAIDPVYDFRWKSYYCSGPQVAPFICELPVPEWAKKEDGCMITSLASLTVTFTPEMGIIQLVSDCGLDGTRRIACKGGVNRDEMVRRLSCDEDAFATTTNGKSTTDAVKEVNTQENPWLNEVKPMTRDLTTQELLKSWEADLPQTRHKRETNESSQSSVLGEANVQTTDKTSTDSTDTQRPNVLNGPSRVFPHSPSERNSMSTNTPAASVNATTVPAKEEKTATTPRKEPEEKTATTARKEPEEKVIQTAKRPAVPLMPPKLIKIQKIVNTETTTKPSEGVVTVRPAVSTTSKEVPVLITTGEPANESATTNTTTSENSQFVTMDEGKEGFAEPYLVPVGEDVINNSPSLSPLELLDVDVMELDNVTSESPSTTIKVSTAPTTGKTEETETTQSTPTTPKISHGGIHPLRLGEKSSGNQNGTTTVTTTTATATTTTTITASPTTPPATTVSEPTQTSTTNYPSTTIVVTANKPTDNPEQMLQNAVERDNKGDGMDMPQRPNRGRLLTHSSHPSFYPYFLNRVLG